MQRRTVRTVLHGDRDAARKLDVNRARRRGLLLAYGLLPLNQAREPAAETITGNSDDACSPASTNSPTR